MNENDMPKDDLVEKLKGVDCLGKVILTNFAGRALVKVGQKFYIANSAAYYRDEECFFDMKYLVKVPSFLYGCAMLDESNVVPEAEKLQNAADAFEKILK